eukprot:SAG11_NODE_44075_length_159_cov_17.000000_1_plen_44_part_10
MIVYYKNKIKYRAKFPVYDIYRGGGAAPLSSVKTDDNLFFVSWP